MDDFVTVKFKPKSQEDLERLIRQHAKGEAVVVHEKRSGILWLSFLCVSTFGIYWFASDQIFRPDAPMIAMLIVCHLISFSFFDALMYFPWFYGIFGQKITFKRDVPDLNIYMSACPICDSQLRAEVLGTFTPEGDVTQKESIFSCDSCRLTWDESGMNGFSNKWDEE